MTTKNQNLYKLESISSITGYTNNVYQILIYVTSITLNTCSRNIWELLVRWGKTASHYQNLVFIWERSNNKIQLGQDSGENRDVQLMPVVKFIKE